MLLFDVKTVGNKMCKEKIRGSKMAQQVTTHAAKSNNEFHPQDP